MRTNIEIDDELMRQAMAATNATTKKGAVEEALRLMVQIKGQGAALRKLRGKIVWRGPDDDWFASDEEVREKRRQEYLATAAPGDHPSDETPVLAATGTSGRR
jgi:Arc/MetJ family transcription regulator